MAFWNRPKKTEVETAPKPRVSEARVLGTSQELGDFLMLGTKAFDDPQAATGALNLYNQSTAVSVPVNEVASAFSQLQPILVSEDGTVEREHPLLQLLKRPSPFFDQSLFMEVMATNYMVTGEAFVVAVGRVAAPPLQLNPISPTKLVANLHSDNLVSAWQVTDDINMDVYEATPESALSLRYLDQMQLKELQQIRNFSTRSNSMVRGQSPLVSASKEVAQHILGGKHNVSLLERGGRLSLVFHFEEDLNEDDFLEAQDRVHQNYSGADKAGKIAVTSGPSLDIKEFGVNNKDMDFGNLQKMIREVVSQVYHVPLPLVSTSVQTFDNYGQAKVALYDDAVNPVATRIYGGLAELLMPRYGLDPATTRIWYDADLVPALKMRRNEELVLRRGVNIESTNELRSAVGLEDVDGGDEIMISSTLVPLGEDPFDGDGSDIPGPLQPTPPTQPEPPEQPEDEVDDEDGE